MASVTTSASTVWSPSASTASALSLLQAVASDQSAMASLDSIGSTAIVLEFSSDSQGTVAGLVAELGSALEGTFTVTAEGSTITITEAAG